MLAMLELRIAACYRGVEPLISIPKTLQNHHLKGLRPLLSVMGELGFSADQCLSGTGLTVQQVEGAEGSLEHQQEFGIYRNCLQLTQDPLLGLSLGKAYRIESYGILGYAMLSSANLREALAIACEFSVLTFSHFQLEFSVSGDRAELAFSRQFELPEDLLPIYSDRDISAALTAFKLADLGDQGPISLALVHGGQNARHRYQNFFNCPITWNAPRNAIVFSADLLHRPLPQRDSETARFCRARCRELIDSATPVGLAIQLRVRDCLMARKERFPSAEEVAAQLGMSVRTLRRRLADEGTHFQVLLDDVRHQLALDWLSGGQPVQAVADRLGYSEAANFSHAFKRWQGCSPQHYQQMMEHRLPS